MRRSANKVATRWLRRKIWTAARVPTPKATKLYVFDFDGTLHRSPPPPEGSTEANWWATPGSLEPPHVPDTTTPDMWKRETVNAMKAAIDDPDAYVVVMTGRHESLKGRVGELLDEIGLKPDELITNPNIGNTTGFKRDELLYLLKSFPNVREVEFWEDKKADLKGYQRAGEKAGVRFTPRLVADYTDKEPPYLGLFLTPESQRKLLKQFPPKHGEVHADHVTLQFKPTKEQMTALKRRRRLGDRVDVEVVGYAEDGQAQAVVVKLPEDLKLDGRTPHVTLSTAKGVEPRYSNELLGRGYKPMPPVTVRGVLDGPPISRVSPLEEVPWWEQFDRTAPTPERAEEEYAESSTFDSLEYGPGGVGPRGAFNDFLDRYRETQVSNPMSRSSYFGWQPKVSISTLLSWTDGKGSKDNAVAHQMQRASARVLSSMYRRFLKSRTTR
jgi:hypothetical protein